MLSYRMESVCCSPEIEVRFPIWISLTFQYSAVKLGLNQINVWNLGWFRIFLHRLLILIRLGKSHVRIADTEISLVLNFVRIKGKTSQLNVNFVSYLKSDIHTFI